MKARSIVIGIVALVIGALVVPVASATTITPDPKLRFSLVTPNPRQWNTVTPNPRVNFGTVTPNPKITWRTVTPNPRIRFSIVTPNPRFWGGEIPNPRIRW